MKKLIISGLLLLATAGLLIFVYSLKKWDGKTRFTIVSLGDVVKVKSFDPVTSLGVEIELPSKLIISSVSGRGEWKAEKIAQAGKPGWVVDSLTNTLGLQILSEEDRLSLIDKILWEWWKRKVVWKQVDVSFLGFLIVENTPDGETVYKLSGAWDKYVSDSLSSVVIAKNGMNVVIVNTTGEVGLGASASRLVESMGLRVVEVNSSDSHLEKCVVSSRKEIKHSVEVESLISAFDCEWKEGHEDGLQLELGEKYRKWRDG